MTRFSMTRDDLASNLPYSKIVRFEKEFIVEHLKMLTCFVSFDKLFN